MQGKAHSQAAGCDIGKLQTASDLRGIKLELEEGNHLKARDDGSELSDSLQLLLALFLQINSTYTSRNVCQL